MRQTFNIGNAEARLKKDIKNLEAQIELMKCCGNCKHQSKNPCNYSCNFDNKVYWELKESD